MMLISKVVNRNQTPMNTLRIFVSKIKNFYIKSGTSCTNNIYLPYVFKNYSQEF